MMCTCPLWTILNTKVIKSQYVDKTSGQDDTVLGFLSLLQSFNWNEMGSIFCHKI